MVEPQLIELADRFLSLTLLIYAVYKMSSALTNRTDQLIAHLQEQVKDLGDQLKDERRLHSEYHQREQARQRGDTRPLPRLTEIPRESDDLP